MILGQIPCKSEGTSCEKQIVVGLSDGHVFIYMAPAVSLESAGTRQMPFPVEIIQY